MAESAAQKKAREKAEADAATKAAQEQADADKAAADQKAADDLAASRTPEENAAAEQAKADAEAKGAPTPKDVPNTENADASTPGVADQDEVDAQRRGEGKAKMDPVNQQRADEQAAADLAEGQRRGDLDADGNPVERSEGEQALLDAAPGGQRTLLTGSTEGSTKVKDTAAFASPASGPLHDPVNDITNLRARDDDPDNRVYGDDAGPRDEAITGVGVETQTRIVDGNGNAPETRFLDADGNALSYEDIFDDQPNRTFVTTKVRVREAFVYPNTDTVGYRIAYTEGKKVPRGEAENVRRMIEGDNR